MELIGDELRKQVSPDNLCTMKTGREKIQGEQRGCLHHLYLLIHCVVWRLKQHVQGTSNKAILPCELSTVFPRAGLLEELL